MGTFASNVIGSHGAPPDATLLHFFSKYLIRTLFFARGPKRAILSVFPPSGTLLSFSHFESAGSTEVEATGTARAAAAAVRAAGAALATVAAAAVVAMAGGGSGRWRRGWRVSHRAGSYLRPDNWCTGHSPSRPPDTGSICVPVLRPGTSSHRRLARLAPRRAACHGGSSRSGEQGRGRRLLWPGSTRPGAASSNVRPEPHSKQPHNSGWQVWLGG